MREEFQDKDKRNFHAIKEAIEMGNSRLTIEQVFEDAGLAAKWEARAEERKALDIAQNMVNLGLPVETIVSATQLDIEKIKILYKTS